jgi:hypothetical protein
MKPETFLLLGKKRIATVITLWIIAIAIHYLIYYKYNFDEPFMFLVAIFIIPVYFFICLLYSMFYFNNKEEK